MSFKRYQGHTETVPVPPRAGYRLNVSMPGRVLLPDTAPWLNEFKNELLGFPGAKHDDQVDSVELFLRFVTGRRGSRMAGPRDGSGRPERARPEGRRSTRFNARRYLNDMLRPPFKGPSLF